MDNLQNYLNRYLLLPEYQLSPEYQRPETPYVEPDQNDPANFGGWPTWSANNPNGTFEEFKRLITIPEGVDKAQWLINHPETIHGGTGLPYDLRNPVALSHSNFNPLPPSIKPRMMSLSSIKPMDEAIKQFLGGGRGFSGALKNYAPQSQSGQMLTFDEWRASQPDKRWSSVMVPGPYGTLIDYSYAEYLKATGQWGSRTIGIPSVTTPPSPALTPYTPPAPVAPRPQYNRYKAPPTSIPTSLNSYAPPTSYQRPMNPSYSGKKSNTKFSSYFNPSQSSISNDTGNTLLKQGVSY